MFQADEIAFLKYHSDTLSLTSSCITNHFIFCRACVCVADSEQEYVTENEEYRAEEMKVTLRLMGRGNDLNLNY